MKDVCTLASTGIDAAGLVLIGLLAVGLGGIALLMLRPNRTKGSLAALVLTLALLIAGAGTVAAPSAFADGCSGTGVGPAPSGTTTSSSVAGTGSTDSTTNSSTSGSSTTDTTEVLPTNSTASSSSSTGTSETTTSDSSTSQTTTSDTTTTTTTTVTETTTPTYPDLTPRNFVRDSAPIIDSGTIDYSVTVENVGLATTNGQITFTVTGFAPADGAITISQDPSETLVMIDATAVPVNNSLTTCTQIAGPALQCVFNSAYQLVSAGNITMSFQVSYPSYDQSLDGDILPLTMTIPNNTGGETNNTNNTTTGDLAFDTYLVVDQLTVLGDSGPSVAYTMRNTSTTNIFTVPQGAMTSILTLSDPALMQSGHAGAQDGGMGTWFISTDGGSTFASSQNLPTSFSLAPGEALPFDDAVVNFSWSGLLNPGPAHTGTVTASITYTLAGLPGVHTDTQVIPWNIPVVDGNSP